MSKIDEHLDLDLSGMDNETVEASDIDHVLIGSDTTDLAIRAFKGQLDVVGANELTVRRLRLMSCSITTMSSSEATFEDCEFVDCSFSALRALGVSFMRCAFKGVVRSGIFDCRDGRHEPPKSRPFEGNDFRQCELRNTAFRGGIDLRKQHFTEEQSKLIIPAAAKLLAQLDVSMKSGRVAEGVRGFHEFLRRSVVDFNQAAVFLSADLLQKNFLADLQGFRGTLASISPELAQWLAEAERICVASVSRAPKTKA